MAEKPAAGGQGGGKKKMLIFALAGVIMFGSGGIIGKVMFAGGKSSSKAAAHEEEEDEENQKVGATLQLEEFIVNLAGGDAYLKATFALGLKEGVQVKKMEEETAPIRDAIIEVLTAKSHRDISTPEGRAKLKEEMVSHINDALPGKPVVKIFFVNFASQ